MPNIITRIQSHFEKLVLLAVAVLIGSCCSDCPTGPSDPGPYKGWLYALDFQNKWVYVIDTENDSLVDSIQYQADGIYNPGAMAVSPDGKYLSISYYSSDLTDRLTIIYDTRTLEEIHRFDRQYESVFIPQNNLFVGIMHDSIIIYSTPTFSRIYSEPTVRLMRPIFIQNQGLIYLHGALLPESFDSTFIAAYDYEKREITNQWFIHDSRDSLVTIYSFDIDAQGKYVYCITGSYFDGVDITCYDLKERDVIYRIPFNSTTGSLMLSPDGSELYVTDPGYFMEYEIPGIIFVLDARTGNYIDGIPLYYQGNHIAGPLYATPILFTPTGEKAYAGSGRVEKGSGTVSVIDTKERRIVKNIWPDMGHYIGFLYIAPKNTN